MEGIRERILEGTTRILKILPATARHGTIRALQESKPGLLSVFRSRRMAVLFVFGFASGLPLFLTGQTLQAWLTAEHASLDVIGAVNSFGLAYTLKFLWAPLLDRFTLPLLGRRRGWVVVFQVALMVTIAAMGMVDPIEQPALLGVLAISVAFLSASQDVVLDAYNADLLEPRERAAGTSIYVLGYRVAMLVTGTLALVMADHLPWRVIYGTMALLMSVGIVGTLFAEEPQRAQRAPTTLQSGLVQPFVAFVRKLGWRRTVLVLGFAALYRFGDYFAQSLILPFLKDGIGFEYTEIAAVNKALAFVGTAIGGVCAGGLVARFGLRRMLVAFGALAAATNLFYVWLAFVGKSLPIFCAAVLCDNIATALGVAAFIAVLMSATTASVSATQFALLTSLSSVGQRLFGRYAAAVVHTVGWSGFFGTTVAMAIPGLVLAWFVARTSPRLLEES